jgi:hypothetical protein
MRRMFSCLSAPFCFTEDVEANTHPMTGLLGVVRAIDFASPTP